MLSLKFVKFGMSKATLITIQLSIRVIAMVLYTGDYPKCINNSINTTEKIHET
jgi:hypothetical protein